VPRQELSILFLVFVVEGVG